jgi:hypothetical protein
VVGRAGQNGRRTVDLLGQHGSDEGVRPGLRTEGETFASLAQDLRVEAIGAADDEGRTADPLVPQVGQTVGEGARGQGAAVLVAGDQDAALIDPGQDDFGLRGLARLAGFDLDNLHGPEAQSAAGSARPRGPVEREFGFGSRSEAPDAEQDDLEAQFAAVRWPESTDQIFSML